VDISQLVIQVCGVAWSWFLSNG